MSKKLIVALAVRNKGSRLYGKPLQNIDIENAITILDFLIQGLNKIKLIDEVVLGISEGIENMTFVDYAEKNKINFIVGDQTDVLGRLIKCAQHSGANEILRVTSESPFPHYEKMQESILYFRKKNLDGYFYDDIIDGCGFEILKTAALEYAHKNGEEQHRSELCTLYIRENKDKFNLEIAKANPEFFRKDLRLTVDYPEDLVVCRAVYSNLKKYQPNIPLKLIIEFLDLNPELKKLIAPFSEAGYQLMYK